MTPRPPCRARPGPVLVVEAFLGERPGLYRPDELAPVLAGRLEASTITEVVAHLLASGRAALDDDGRLVGHTSAAPMCGDDPLSGMSDNDHPDGLR